MNALDRIFPSVEGLAPDSELVLKGLRVGPIVAALVAVFFISAVHAAPARSPHISKKTRVMGMENSQALLTAPDGKVPYQKWKLPEWKHKKAYVWVVGNHDFRKHDSVDLILYFHGMHSKDYYQAFQATLDKLAKKRPGKPFLFVGFVDTPFRGSGYRKTHRWKTLVHASGERPKRLFTIVNRVYKAFKKQFPHVKKDKTRIVLTAFSGGGRVLRSVGKWLAQSPKDDFFAKAFRSHLTKIVYFDCWFNPTDVDTVHQLLQSNPSMKIVGTVHMGRPKKHAKMLADKFKMKRVRRGKPSVGLGGRFVIFRDKSHWDAMISRLEQALDV